MSIRHLSLLAVVSLGAALLSACNEQALPQAPGAGAGMAPTVALVDVDAVARALGRDVAMREQLQSAGAELNTEVRDLAQELKDSFEAERQLLGENPSQEQREQLARMGLEAQTRVQRSQAAAQRKAQELQVQLARQIQDEVRPVAAAVARERGAQVVLSTTFVLWAEAATDITAAVIERMETPAAQ